jgi:hypothetical protein
VFTCVAGNDADTILNLASSLGIVIWLGQDGITTNRLDLVPPLNPSLNEIMLLLNDDIIV